MNGKLIVILLGPAIGMIAGVFLAYLGFFSPVFRRSSEQLAPDRWVGVFRAITRIIGPVLCIAAGYSIFSALEVLPWREFTSLDGRFRISAPGEFVMEVKNEPYGSESFFRVIVPTQAFLVSYVDLPAGLLKAGPNEVLNSELDARLQVAGLRLLSKESTSFAGCPAVRFKLHNVAGGYFVEGIFLLAKGRRYQLAVQFTSETSAPNREQFFNSFRLLDGP